MTVTTAYRKQFISGLNDLSAWEGWRHYEGMSNFLTCAFNAIRKSTVFGEAADKCEENYMAVVKRCQKPDKTMTVISQMFGLITLALEAELKDFIGPVFMDTSASERMGQFFTPDSVCHLMAETQLSDAAEILKHRSHITIDEPACGSGAMILACCRYLKAAGINYQTRCGFRLTDLDHDAFMAAYIQCSLAGVPARVIHGNTLTLKTRDAAITPMLMIRPWLARESRRITNDVLAQAPVSVVPVVESPDGQLAIDWAQV